MKKIMLAPALFIAGFTFSQTTQHQPDKFNGAPMVKLSPTETITKLTLKQAWILYIY